MDPSPAAPKNPWIKEGTRRANAPEPEEEDVDGMPSSAFRSNLVMAVNRIGFQLSLLSEYLGDFVDLAETHEKDRKATEAMMNKATIGILSLLEQSGVVPAKSEIIESMKAAVGDYADRTRPEAPDPSTGYTSDEVHGLL